MTDICQLSAGLEPATIRLKVDNPSTAARYFYLKTDTDKSVTWETRISLFSNYATAKHQPMGFEPTFSRTQTSASPITHSLATRIIFSLQ